MRKPEHHAATLLALAAACSLSAACGTPAKRSTAACRPVSPVVDIDAPQATVSYDVRPSARGPVGLMSASGVWTGSEYLIFGGSSPASPGPAGTLGRYKDEKWDESSEGSAWTTPGYAYNPAADSWRQLPGRPIYDTSGEDPVAWHCGRVFLLNHDGNGFRYHIKTGKTEPTSNEGTPGFCRGRVLHTHGDYAMIWGCRGCDAHVYDRRHDTWTTVGGTPAGGELGSCDFGRDGLVGDRFVFLLGDGSGSYWDIGSDGWQQIPAPDTPIFLDSGPVGDADAVYVLGRTKGDQQRAVYRYDFRMRSWSHELLTGGSCQGRLTALRDGVLIQADSYPERDPFLCAFDLANATRVDGLPEGHRARGNVTIFGEDQIFVWASTSRSKYHGEEMYEMPTVGVHNGGWLIDLRVER